jgi:DNA ligase 1
MQVPIGAWHGNGRKAGWYSPFLLACWDPVAEEYQVGSFAQLLYNFPCQSTFLLQVDCTLYVAGTLCGAHTAALTIACCLQSVCRVMSGFTDTFYKVSKERYDRDHLCLVKKPYYNTSESPDVWFEPVEVWEIRGADLTLSPVHKAAVGKVHPERGCSLRFPRFIKACSQLLFSASKQSNHFRYVHVYNTKANGH